MPDIPANSSTSATLTLGGYALNSIESNGDHDWFAISLTAGVQVTISLFGISLEDPYVNVRDSAGNILASNDDIKSGQNRNSELTFTPTASGTFYVDVGAFNDAYSGTYQVSVQSDTQNPVAAMDTLAAYLYQGDWAGDDHHFAVSQGGTITVNISSLSSGGQNLARFALQQWSAVIGVNFQEVANGAQITFSDNEDSSGGPVASTDTSWAGGIISSANVHISGSWLTRYGSGLNTYSMQAYVHEIGHALGLGHGGDYNGSATYSTDALFQNDCWSTTVMSYFDQSQNRYFADQGFNRAYAVTPMQADIVAMQVLYGLSTTTRTGDSVYGFNSNVGGMYDAATFPNVAVTVFDNGGNDTLDYSGTAAAQVLNLNPASFSNVLGGFGNLGIDRTSQIENAIGGSGTDTLIGNDAANVLTGGLGVDSLTGGAGADTFRDSRAGLNGDTILDFTSLDKIVFTDAVLGSFTFSVTGTTLNYTGGSLTFGSAPTLGFTASAAAGGGVQLVLSGPPVVVRDVVNDFNGDGRSDVLWRSQSGTLTDWLGQANGGFFANSANFNQAISTGWQVVGTGDFNGDGRDDVLWRDQSGTVTNWLGQPNGAFAGNSGNLYQNVSTAWQVAATGDFNGDGRDDVLWRNQSGTVTDWLGQTNGAFAGNSANLFQTVGTSWQVIGSGDFNGDGRADILWRDQSGIVTDWLGQANGSFAGNAGNLFQAVPTSWQVVATGDFNGDGRVDLLWRDQSGTVTDWLGQPNGAFSGNSGNLYSAVPTNWQVVGHGDFNGDGRDDVLWRDQSGTVTDWLGQPNGAFIGNSGNLWMSSPSDWHVQSLATMF